MEAEDLVVDQGGQGEVVKKIGEVFPYIGITIFSQAFVVEAVDLGDLSGLVVPTEDGDSVGIADLEGNEECYGLDGVVSSVNIVSCPRRQLVSAVEMLLTCP